MNKPFGTLLACVVVLFASTAAGAAPVQRGLAAALAEALGAGVASVDNTGTQVKPKKPR